MSKLKPYSHKACANGNVTHVGFIINDLQMVTIHTPYGLFFDKSLRHTIRELVRFCLDGEGDVLLIEQSMVCSNLRIFKYFIATVR